MTWRDTFASLSTEDKIAAAILCAWPTTDSIPWRRWAVGWLTGEDRGSDRAKWAYLATGHFSPSSYAAQSVLYDIDGARLAVELAAVRHHIDPSPILDDIAVREEILAEEFFRGYTVLPHSRLKFREGQHAGFPLLASMRAASFIDSSIGPEPAMPLPAMSKPVICRSTIIPSRMPFVLSRSGKRTGCSQAANVRDDVLPRFKVCWSRPNSTVLSPSPG